MKVLLALAISLPVWAASLTQRAPVSEQRRTNPLAGDATAVRAGAKLYEHECSACHGADREGFGKRPPLTTPWVIKAPPGSLDWVLRNGSLVRGMPSFASLPQGERWQIISFLQKVKD